MRLSVVPFRAAHVGSIKVAAFQESIMDTVLSADLSAVTKQRLSYSAFIDGKVVACAGLVVSDKAWAWGLFSAMGVTSFGRVHRLVLAGLDKQPFDAVWARVSDHAPALRWIERLGFQLDQPAVGYFPDGTRASIYVRKL